MTKKEFLIYSLIIFVGGLIFGISKEIGAGVYLGIKGNRYNNYDFYDDIYQKHSNIDKERLKEEIMKLNLINGDCK